MYQTFYVFSLGVFPVLLILFLMQSRSMRHQTHEIALAYELIVQATDRLEPLMHPEDLEAGIVASLATALEIASHRQLKELNEIYQTKSI